VTWSQLQNKKNLLAFSAGVDSSALFFMLLEQNITFDIALVNYGLREEASKEEQHAIELAKQYNLKCYTTKAPSFKNNFEKNARDFRYAFFDKTMQENNYNNLLTAHQLNDQLEWFLMRLTKGAGTTELIGLEAFSVRKNYHVVRPLLQYPKQELLDYLKTKEYPYFVDKSNFTEKYERNRFREKFSNTLIEEYTEGIQRSFDYLHQDKETLLKGYKEVFHQKKLYILTYENKDIKIRIIDKYLKKLGYLLSGKQRQELQNECSSVVGGLWAVEIKENTIYIAPYLSIAVPKEFKEHYRVAKIPSKIRPYIYSEEIDIKDFLNLI